MVWTERIPRLLSPKVEQQRLSTFLLVCLLLAAVSLVVMLTTDQFSLRAYFVVAFILVLICSEIFAPTDPDADWWRWIQLLKVVGWLLFAYIIFERVAGTI